MAQRSPSPPAPIAQEIVMATITLQHEYPYPADLVWAVATDLDHLKEVVAGLVEFRNLPSGRIYHGQRLDVDVSLFGKLPYKPYHMHVAHLDDAVMHFKSSEKGAGVKSWNHELNVVAADDGSRVTETIEIDAGLLTPIFKWWASYLYRSRHQPRMRILERLYAADNTA